MLLGKLFKYVRLSDEGFHRTTLSCASICQALTDAWKYSAHKEKMGRGIVSFPLTFLPTDLYI